MRDFRLALLLLTAAGFPSLASAGPEHIRIQFSASKQCPDGSAFVRALRQRTGRFQLGAGAEETRVFVATITGADPLVAGRLEIRGPGTDVSVRKVSGKTCDEVMEALALMTALAIDPNVPNAPNPPSAPHAAAAVNPPSGAASSTPPAGPGPSLATAASLAPTARESARESLAPARESLAPARGESLAPARESLAPTGAANRTPKPKALDGAPTPSRGATSAAPPAASPSTREPHAPEPPRAEPALPEPLPPPAAKKSPATEPGAPAATGWMWSAGVHGGGSLRVSPTPGLGGLLFVEAAAPGTATLAPVLRGGLFLNQSDATVRSGAGAGFQWAAALLEGCPIRLLAVDGRIGLFPCLAFHLGVLRGEGRNLDQPERTTDLWADLGPVARIRVAVLARLYLEAQGMLVFPLRRLTFEVQDRGPASASTTVFAVPLVGLLAGIGVGYGFE
jgi:hypothetical protein